VAANTSGSQRYTTLTIANQSYIVSQQGAATCAASAASTPQVSLEGRTELLGDLVVACTGLASTVTADISLALNVNVTSVDAALSVNGGAAVTGTVLGYNTLRWPGVQIAPGATVKITKVRADAAELASPGAITGIVAVSGLPVTGGKVTLANAARGLVFTRLQASPPAGGAQTTVSVKFQEGFASAFTANVTRLRMVLTSVPSTVQVWAPIYPAEGPTGAQLYSALADGSGGSALTGSTMFGGTYQQLTATNGTVTATWLVLAANASTVDTFTFPLVLTNAAINDLNTMQVAGSLGPVSTVAIASASAPVPRYRDFSTPQKLVNLRVTTTMKNTGTSAPSHGPLLPVSGGATVSITSQVVNDTSDVSGTANGVTLQNNLPTGLTIVSCTASGAVCGGSGNQVQLMVGSLGPGQTASVTVVAQVNSSVAPGTVVDDSVSAASDGVNLDLGAGTATASLIVLAGTPVAVGGSPAFGSGPSQSFTFQFSDPAGYQQLGVVNVLINSALDGRNACYLAYSVTAKTLYLVDDQGDAGGPYAAVSLGDLSTIQNSQCAVMLTSAIGSGSTLSLVLNITFKAAFGGNQIVYVAARDQATLNTGWQALSVWQTPSSAAGISVAGLSPARVAASAGTNKQLVFTFTDAKGTGDFGVVNVLVNDALDGRHACYLAYAVQSGALYLVDDQGDAGGPFAGSMTLNGGTGGVQNSQCSVTAAGSSAMLSANTLTLTLNMTFTGLFLGNHVVYAAARDGAGAGNTGWQAVGTWTVQ